MKKVLVFTYSYKRPFMLRSVINDIKNQSYNNLKHVINITTGKNLDLSPIYSDLLSDKLSIVYSDNKHLHINAMNTIKSVPDYENYDIFIKVDDDDIHKKHYVENIVNLFEKYPDIDITSSKVRFQLNGDILRENKQGFDNLGGNPENTNYRMPFTFAFTLKALHVIENLTDLYHYEDYIWRYAWEKEGLKHLEVDNKDEVIWYIHGKI